jgi:adenylylsulfate reductase subunit B
MVVDPVSVKAFNQDPWQCWECYCCVKICPTRAVGVRGYADFVPMGASVVPRRSARRIAWTITFRDGTIKRFEFPIRTTPAGQADPSGGWPSRSSLDTEDLFTEPDSLGTLELWTK